MPHDLTAAEPADAVAASAPADATAVIPFGISIVIRLRRPLFSWGF
jgi:hypothetical protein